MAARKGKKEDRQEVSVKLPGESFGVRSFDCEDLDSVIAQLQAIRDAHKGKKLRLSLTQEAYSDYEIYEVYERRPETDEEMAARHALLAQQQAANEARERQEFKRLEKKFGSRR